VLAQVAAHRQGFLENLMRISRRALGAGALALLGSATLLAQAARAAPDVEGARAFIADLGQRAVDVLGNPSLGRDEERRQLYALLEQGFDLEMLARLAAGRSWREMSPAQQETFRKVFNTYILDTYSQRLASYSGEQLRIDRAQAVSDTDVMVQATVLSQQYPPWRMDWRVRVRGGGFKVVDVLIEGVSMVVTQRNEFNAVVQAQGVDGLTEMLRERIRQAGGTPPA
jgi:phospholipid transport system substrate-binding protein